MGKKKIANLSKESLFEMGDALKTQFYQLNSLEEERDDILSGIDAINQNNQESSLLLEEAEEIVDSLLSNMESLESFVLDEIVVNLEDVEETEKVTIKKTASIRTNNNWQDYLEEYSNYAKQNSMDLTFDPFVTSLSQREYEKLKNEINDEFAKKTSIINKTDLSFLAIATALQVTKALVFPIVSQKVGYGEGFDKEGRKNHNDKSIKEEEKKSKDKFRDTNTNEGNENGEWMEILYRKPIFDTTKGSPDIGINMEGGYHRIHTLGHDPVLGWIFGTSNILTDTITMDTFATYQGARDPIRITPERVSLIDLFDRTIEKVKAGTLNLPAALAAEKIHLKSDEFTKAGLPVPILETIAPKLAGNLYKSQYDALCLSRDLKVIGTSAAISMLIDIIIGLVHSLYYDADKDGTKDMFEVRTRKILLISNTIATTSNLILSAVTKNPKNLDIGGLLVTLSHLFCDTRFIVNVKKEFIENRIYEKIEDELKAIDENQDKLFAYEYNNSKGIQFL
ncbi:hypothetical protein [Clostridium fungisolvens]|uniref:Uncharacterized protein n=1 Tax=Clostridium fungisolvens TaxID=1604897 RepID=A0A6V8SIR7_9CLOT|nr:hypothetical protein [Clostridium fungisolvens]GFP76641.1 hypothetical protein bsdtw1_02744 [Clostridium fungisolvens]